MKDSLVSVNGHEVKLTNLDKLLWPEGLTKAHLVKYYWEIAPISCRISTTAVSNEKVPEWTCRRTVLPEGVS